MDFYVLLGLHRDAGPGDIKRAYRRLARKLHPDINPGDRVSAARFQQIAEAYETLSDPEQRRRYDSVGPTRALAGERSFGFEGFDFSASVSGTLASTFGDLFGDVLHQRDERHPETASGRGADLHQIVTLSFAEAVRGGLRDVTVTRYERCLRCDGSRRIGTPETACARCQGAGVAKSVRGHMVFSKPCVHCRGTGRQTDTRCPTCAGEQTEMRTEALTINIPAGLADGARIRLPGKGHAGRHGGEPGDVYITVRVEPHRLFRRQGDDLYLTCPIAIHEAALGARVEIPTLDGPARLRVPPGTQSGQRFRLRERGVPSGRDGRRGDLVVEVHMVLPKILDERSKELLREFGGINSEDVRKELTRSELI